MTLYTVFVSHLSRLLEKTDFEEEDDGEEERKRRTI